MPGRGKQANTRRGRAALAAFACAAGSLIGAPSLDRAWAEARDDWSEIIVTAPARSPDPMRVNTTGQDFDLVVPIRDQAIIGQVAVTITAANDLLVSQQDLANALSRLVAPEALARLTELSARDGRLTAEQVAGSGFELEFDQSLLELAVRIPVEYRQTQSMTLGFGDPYTQSEATADPQPFGVYLNYRAALDYVHDGFVERGLREPRVDMELNGRFGRFAFENELGYDGESGQGLVRSGSRAIFDQPDKALRWTLGDLFVDATGFQSGEDIGGVQVSRLYNVFQPSRTIAARSSRTITLREAALVDLRVNGTVVRQLRLQPGTYDVRDLPLAQGANFVELVIQSETGATEVVSFDFFSNSALLAQGVDEFSFSAGVVSDRDFRGVNYEEDRPAFSGFYRRGLSDQLTAGVNAQGTDRNQLVGAEALYANDLGLFRAEAAFSSSDFAGEGYSIRGEYRYFRQMPERGGARVFNLGLETRSENFTAVADFDPVNDYGLIVTAQYAQPLTRTLSWSVGGDYSFGRDSREDRYGATAFFNWTAPRDFNVNFGASYSNSAIVGESEVNAFFNITKRFGPNQSATISGERRNERLSASYSRSPTRALDDYGLTLDVTRTRGDVGLSGAATYFSNRGEAELSHFTTFDEVSGGVSQQQSSVRVNGAIGFTDGRFAIGNRIYDSFAIVRSDPSLEGRPVLIQQRLSNDPVARSGLLGPALVRLNSYSNQVVPYDVADLPPGYDLGVGAFELLPPLHSAYSLKVGSPYNVTVIGELRDADGERVTLRSGLATSRDDPSAPQVQVITNRQGRFGAAGLSPGRWRIVFRGTPSITYDIVVPDSPDALYRSGVLTPTLASETTP